jgi:Dyp-type peroxidase family
MNPPGALPLLSAEARADIQGFITSAFAHLPSSAYLLARFGERAAARRWLQALRPKLTPASTWRPGPDAPKQKPLLTLNLAFTAAGLRALGLPENCLETFPTEFLEGMASADRARILGDTGESGASRWQFGGPATHVIHALLIVCSPGPEARGLECGRIRSEAAANGMEIVAEELGDRPPHDKEPFGFRDGIAQPQIKGIKGAGVNTGEFILGYENEYGYHPVSPWLDPADDPLGLLPDSANPYSAGRRDLGLNGTFIVYRKLEQDVAGFWRFMEAESIRRLGRSDPRFMIWLAAKMVGRWPGGAPLALAPDRDDPGLGAMDQFLYADSDPRGLGCPFGAHIRRVNPRDQLRPAGPEESLHMTARHRILRRGKPFGPALFDLTRLDRPDDGEGISVLRDLRNDGLPRGLHFLCVNASIKSQFEFIQQAWANNPHFNGLTANPDPLIGNSGEETPAGSMWIPRSDLDLRTASLPRFVTVRGGGYFFMPGLRTLAYLAAP